MGCERRRLQLQQDISSFLLATHSSLGRYLSRRWLRCLRQGARLCRGRAAAACHRSAGARPLYAVHKALCFLWPLRTRLRSCGALAMGQCCEDNPPQSLREMQPSGGGRAVVGHWRRGSAARMVYHKAREGCRLHEDAALLWGARARGSARRPRLQQHRLAGARQAVCRGLLELWKHAAVVRRWRDPAQAWWRTLHTTMPHDYWYVICSAGTEHGCTSRCHTQPATELY